MPERCAFSETTYAFCYLREIIAAWGIVGPPLMPSTYAEGKSGGFDAAVMKPTGLILFVQFKIPKTLTHSHAGESRDLGLPYFRTTLPRRRPDHSMSQHEMLVEQGSHPRCASMYAMPRFSSGRDLHRHYLSGSIHANSFCPYAADLGALTSDEEHSLNYRAVDDKRILRSRPVVQDSPAGPGLLTETGFERLSSLPPFGIADFEVIADRIAAAAPGDFQGFIADLLGGTEGLARVRLAARFVLSAEALPVPSA